MQKKQRGQRNSAGEIDKFIGIRIKFYRELEGKTQKQVAELINVSTIQYIKYENGKSRIPYGTIITLAKNFKFNYGADLLLEAEKEMERYMQKQEKFRVK